MTTFSLFQLSRITGKTVATIRRHVRNGWLKARTYPGAVGLRVNEPRATAWLAIYFPTCSLYPAPAVAVQWDWKRSLFHDSAHLVGVDGKTACAGSPTGAKLVSASAWFPAGDLRRCRVCMSKESLATSASR